MIESIDGRYWIHISKWGDNPTWANNFVDHCYTVAERENFCRIHPAVRASEAKKFNGKYKSRNTFDSIRFDRESDCTMFMMRWL